MFIAFGQPPSPLAPSGATSASPGKMSLLTEREAENQTPTYKHSASLRLIPKHSLTSAPYAAFEFFNKFFVAKKITSIAATPKPMYG